MFLKKIEKYLNVPKKLSYLMRGLKIRDVEKGDIRGIINICVDSFEKDIIKTFSKIPNLLLFEDFMISCYSIEKKGFIVAYYKGKVIGYVIVTRSFKRFKKEFIKRGCLFMMFYHWVTGRYGIGIKPLFGYLKNILLFLKNANKFRKTKKSDAQLLTIAVDKKHRNMGVGSKLVKAVISYARSVGVKEGRAEIRVDNMASLKLNKGLAKEVGILKDSFGDSVVLIKKF